MKKRGKKPDVKPNTGTTTGSGLVSMLERIGGSNTSTHVPSLPDPVFDQFMGKQYKRRKKK